MKKIYFLALMLTMAVYSYAQISVRQPLTYNHTVYSAGVNLFSSVFLNAIVVKDEATSHYIIKDSVTISKEEIDNAFKNRNKRMFSAYIYSYNKKRGEILFYGDGFYGKAAVFRNYLNYIENNSYVLSDIGAKNEMNLRLKMQDYADSLNAKIVADSIAHEEKMEKMRQESLIKWHKEDSIREVRQQEKAKRLAEEKAKEQKKYEANVKKYGKKVADRIRDKMIWVGMTYAMLLDSRGTPDRINIISARYNDEQLIYGNTYIYMKNDIVYDYQVF